MYWVWLFVGSVSAEVIFKLWQHRRKLLVPYSWVCEEEACTFKVTSSHSKFCHEVAVYHMATHGKDYE